MSRLDDELMDTGARLFNLGQDYQTGDGSVFQVDKIVDAEKQTIKDVLIEIIGRNEYESYNNVGAHIRNELREEIRRKVSEL